MTDRAAAHQRELLTPIRHAKGWTADLRETWYLGWWARLDSLGHMLHLPTFIQRRICDRFEEWLSG